MTACVILYNMIIKDERELDMEYNYDNVGSRVKPARDADEITRFLDTYQMIDSRATHEQLQEDLIEHHWQGLSKS